VGQKVQLECLERLVHLEILVLVEKLDFLGLPEVLEGRDPSVLQDRLVTQEPLGCKAPRVLMAYLEQPGLQATLGTLVEQDLQDQWEKQVFQELTDQLVQLEPVVLQVTAAAK